MIRYFNIIFIITIFSLIFSTNEVKAKDCSEYQLLSHEWNKCKLNLKKLKKLNPLKKLKKKNSSGSNNVDKSEKKALLKSKKIDNINKNCSTLADCIKKRKKND